MCQPPKDGDQVRDARAEESALASETLERIAHAREVAVGAAAIANSLADSLITEYAQNLAHAAKVAYIVAYITERRAAAAAGNDGARDTLEHFQRAALIARLLHDSLGRALEQNLAETNRAIVVERERAADLTASLDAHRVRS